MPLDDGVCGQRFASTGGPWRPKVTALNCHGTYLMVIFAADGYGHWSSPFLITSGGAFWYVISETPYATFAWRRALMCASVIVYPGAFYNLTYCARYSICFRPALAMPLTKKLIKCHNHTRHHSSIVLFLTKSQQHCVCYFFKVSTYNYQCTPAMARGVQMYDINIGTLAVNISEGKLTFS